MGIEFVVGTHTKVELISGSHGAVRVPLAQTFDYTPSYDEKRIYEFDSPGIVAVVTNFNGVEVRFDHFDSDSKLVDAALVGFINYVASQYCMDYGLYTRDLYGERKCL